MIKGNPKMNEESIKFLGLAGLIIINGVFVFPFMRAMYNNIFSNNAEITHLVRHNSSFRSVIWSYLSTGSLSEKLIWAYSVRSLLRI